MAKVNMGTILLIDDDAGVLHSTSTLLKSAGYGVVPLSNIEKAIPTLKQNKIDVVITDIIMPEGSGIDLLNHVHEVDPHMPVILMTAHADLEKMIDAIKMGAFDFIMKPISIDLFTHAVEKAVIHRNMAQVENDYRHLLEDFNQEIESLVAERTMSLMALTVADKIRNPATVIGLICRRLLDRKGDQDELDNKLNEVIQEVGKIDTIVNDFEALLKSKKSIFKYEDLNENVESVLRVLVDNASAKGVEIHFSPSERPLKINSQKNLLRIAVSHVINNAIESSPEGGKVSAVIRQEDDAAVLSISDTGEGIPESEIDRIFDPMFSTKEQRFGMGLSLVKQIITEHMGDIHVLSSPDEGTTFTIQLPLKWINAS